MLLFRVMNEDDKDFFMHLMNLVGWGMTSVDFNRMIKFSTAGCFIAEKQGKNVGIVTTTNYGDIAWIGNLVVLPKTRGHAIGANLMKHAMEYLWSTGVASIKLDGVPLAIPLYRRLGFKEEYWSLRYTGQAIEHTIISASPMIKNDLKKVANLDKSVFKATRKPILEYFFELYPDLCFTTWSKERLVGYIMAKQVKDLIKIGPWIVLSGYEINAENLFYSLMNRCIGKKIWVGVPEGNKNCVKILQKNGFTPLLSSLRMCLGNCNLGESVESVYGIGGPDKG